MVKGKKKNIPKSLPEGRKIKTEDGRKKESNPRQSEPLLTDTIFIRNLSFDTEEDVLKEFVEENFGETEYCLICRDKETDDSKGTAFAKFKDPVNAQKCLKDFKDRESQTKFHLEGRNLMVFPALSRDKVQEVKKSDKNKDKRNLALSKEGYIHPNSDEAKKMSKSDLEKRKALFVRKREMLKNLHNFVSDTRLCIHNLPSSVDDVKLRKIFTETTSSGAKIVECRVMRNKMGSGNLGTSKGFGFVAFSKHEHALAALRNLNNNPAIFTDERRPIVEFSIENMVALNKKKTRLVNSQRKNKAIQSGAGEKPCEKPDEKPAKKMKSKTEKFKKIKEIGKMKNKKPRLT